MTPRKFFLTLAGILVLGFSIGGLILVPMLKAWQADLKSSAQVDPAPILSLQEYCAKHKLECRKSSDPDSRSVEITYWLYHWKGESPGSVGIMSEEHSSKKDGHQGRSWSFGPGLRFEWDTAKWLRLRREEEAKRTPPPEPN